MVAAIGVLVLGAAAAAYAAWGKSSSSAKPRRPASTLAASRPLVPVVPVGGAPSATTAPSLGAAGTPTSVKPTLPLPKAPKLPAAATRKPAATTAPASPPHTTTTPATSPKTTGGSPTPPEPQTTALLLDTNAAATYNPYGYPQSGFGDPSLAIDGETSTAWTAQVDPAVAPKMAVGLSIDLKSSQRLAALALTTTTPGMTVRAYATTAPTLPTSITDPAWVRLSRPEIVKKRHLRIALAQPTKTFRFLVLWISRAPASSTGTPQAPAHVSVNELELFPPAK